MEDAELSRRHFGKTRNEANLWCRIRVPCRGTWGAAHYPAGHSGEEKVTRARPVLPGC